MIKNRDLTAFVFGLCPLIPVSSNLAYGIVLTACLWVVFFGGVISNGLSKLIYINGFEKVFVHIFIVFITVFFEFSFAGAFSPYTRGASNLHLYFRHFLYPLFEYRRLFVDLRFT